MPQIPAANLNPTTTFTSVAATLRGDGGAGDAQHVRFTDAKGLYTSQKASASGAKDVVTGALSKLTFGHVKASDHLGERASKQQDGATRIRATIDAELGPGEGARIFGNLQAVTGRDLNQGVTRADINAITLEIARERIGVAVGNLRLQAGDVDMNRLEANVQQALDAAETQARNLHHRQASGAEKDAAVLKAVAKEAAQSASGPGAGAAQQARAARAVVTEAATAASARVSEFLRSSPPELAFARDLLRANDNGYTGGVVNAAGLAAGQGPPASLHSSALAGASGPQTLAAGQQLAQNVDALMTAVVGGNTAAQIQNAAAQVPQALCDLYATIHQAASNGAPPGQGAAFAEKAVVNFFVLRNLVPNLNPVPASQHTAGVTDWATALNPQQQKNLSFTTEMVQKIFNGAPNLKIDLVQDSAELQQAKQTANQAAGAWVQPARDFLQAVVARGVPIP